MFQIATRKTSAAAVLAMTLLAACSPAPQQAAPPRHDAATSGPELAGIWYQVYFDTGSAEVNERGRMIASTVAQVAAGAATTRVTVIGKTDRIGAAPDNLALSRRRANAVRDSLIAAGIPANRIDTSWTGEGGAVVAPRDDTSAPRDRVVDITVIKTP